MDPIHTTAIGPIQSVHWNEVGIMDPCQVVHTNMAKNLEGTEASLGCFTPLFIGFTHL